MDSETYRLTVPLARSGAVGDAPRYHCCHREESLGHGLTCTQEMRVKVIDDALSQAGFTFKHECDEDKSDGRAEDGGDPRRVLLASGEENREVMAREITVPLPTCDHDPVVEADIPALDEALLTKPASWVRLVQEGRVLAEFPISEVPCTLEYGSKPLADSSVRITSMTHVADENMQMVADGRCGNDTSEVPDVPAESPFSVESILKAFQRDVIEPLFPNHEDSAEMERERPTMTGRFSAAEKNESQAPSRENASETWKEGQKQKFSEHCGRVAAELSKGNPVTLVANGRTLGTYLPEPLSPVGFEFVKWPRPLMDSGRMRRTYLRRSCPNI